VIGGQKTPPLRKDQILVILILISSAAAGLGPQEVIRSAKTMLNKVEVTSSNPSSFLLCGHIKKEKQRAWVSKQVSGGS
jgi:hypothetical protein